MSKGRKINSWGKGGCSCPRVYFAFRLWRLLKFGNECVVFFLRKWSLCTLTISRVWTICLLLAGFQQKVFNNYSNTSVPDSLVAAPLIWLGSTWELKSVICQNYQGHNKNDVGGEILCVLTNRSVTKVVCTILFEDCNFEARTYHSHLWSKSVQENKPAHAVREGSVTYFLRSQVFVGSWREQGAYRVFYCPVMQHEQQVEKMHPAAFTDISQRKHIIAFTFSGQINSKSWFNLFCKC